MFRHIQGFQFLNMGYASAVPGCCIIFVLPVINWNARRRWVFEG